MNSSSYTITLNNEETEVLYFVLKSVIGIYINEANLHRREQNLGESNEAIKKAERLYAILGKLILT